MMIDEPLVPPSFFQPPPDAEIDALAVCLRALLPLDFPARCRVIEYLDDRFKRRDDEPARDEASR